MSIVCLRRAFACARHFPIYYTSRVPLTDSALGHTQASLLNNANLTLHMGVEVNKRGDAVDRTRALLNTVLAAAE
jgi:hypothetical protein